MAKKEIIYALLAAQYAKLLFALQGSMQKEMDAILFRYTFDLSKLISVFVFRNNIFDISKYPILRKRVDKILGSLHSEINVTLVNGIQSAWALSDQKNKIFIDKKFSGVKLPGKLKKLLYDPNQPALNQFLNRSSNGLNLSGRVWNITNQLKKDIETNLKQGISVGKSANQLQKTLQQQLLSPKGNTHPGQGVYRSPRKNALRLARTETNMAYQTADFERWNSQPFVVGVSVVLSNNHPDYDICDELAGKYPKNFLFRGWHPQCRCHTEPILITADELDKYENQILGIGKWNGKSDNHVNKPPAEFFQYLHENKDKINRLSNTPYWIKDNAEYTKGLNK